MNDVDCQMSVPWSDSPASTRDKLYPTNKQYEKAYFKLVSCTKNAIFDILLSLLFSTLEEVNRILQT